MSFQVTKGLFSLDDFTDCHAILGVPVTADATTIRKRYLKIARKLHPDSFIGQNSDQEELATQLFSKLVGPAYNTLSQERERKEYMLLIQLKGKQAVQQMVAVDSLGSLAQTLAQADNLDQLYTESVTNLAQTQYENLTESLEITGQLSELNLVYLMRQASANKKLVTTAATPTPTPPPAAATGSTSSPSTPGSTAGSSPGSTAANTATSKTASSLDSYLRRAEDYMAQKDFRSATMDLRDALRIDPNDSRCHALMGKLYLDQGNLPMARVSVKRALELDPQNTTALKAKKELERRGQVVDVGTNTRGGSGSRGSSSSGGQKGGKSDSGGGFLGGLFGGKKK